MSLLIDRWPRITLSATTLALTAMLLLYTLFGEASSSAAPTQQTPPPSSTPQPNTKPIRLTDPVPDPKQEGVVWFPQTGHTLRGAFLDYWNRYGGLAQFGYPLTEEFYEEISSDNKLHLVQYFERNRFEYHPENKGTQYEVLLGLLGLDFGKAAPPATPILGAQYFSELGHNLFGAFKQYWETHGGLFVHGFPIAEPIQEKSIIDGRIYTVQYFQRSRFELHPEFAGSPYEVLLGLLGHELSKRKGFPSGAYPQYGHATNYSWFAGYYRQDPFRCPQCGCQTVQFVSMSNQAYAGVRGVQPYGEDWTRILTDTGLQATPSLIPQTFIVVFGYLDDPNSVATSEPIGSCLSPKLKVIGLQFNSLH